MYYSFSKLPVLTEKYTFCMDFRVIRLYINFLKIELVFIVLMKIAIQTTEQFPI